MPLALITAVIAAIAGFLYGLRVIEDTADVYWGGVILGLLGLALALAFALGSWPAGWRR